MKLNFDSILKRSYNLIIKFKFLWLLGILTAASSGFSGSSYSSSDWFNKFDSNSSDQSFNLQNNFFSKISEGGKVLGTSTADKLTSLNSLTLTIMVILIIFLIICIYLRVTAAGAIVKSVYALDEGTNTTLASSWRFGHKYFWRRFGFGLIMAFLALTPIFITVFIACLISLLHIIALTILVSVIFGLISLASIIYLSLISPYAERILFIKGKDIFTSIENGFRFFNKNWIDIVLVYLINIAFGIIYGIAAMIAMLFCIGIFLLPVILIYTASQVLAICFGLIVLLAIFIVLLIFSGGFQAFKSSNLTLAYKDLDKLVKK